MGEKKEVKCYQCKNRGGVRARKDAYADHKLILGKEVGEVEWQFDTVAIMGEVQAYECFTCNEELDEEELAKYNNIIL